MPAGDCFVAAAHAAREVVVDGTLDRTEVLIAHGLPVLQIGEHAGKRFWHAWVEVKTSGGWIVIDRSNDRNLTLQRSRYYRLGQLNPRTQVWRYSWEQAWGEMTMRGKGIGTFGPWVPGWETMGDEHRIPGAMDAKVEGR